MSRQELASGVWSDIMDMSKPGGLVLWIRADRVLGVWCGLELQTRRSLSAATAVHALHAMSAARRLIKCESGR